MSRLRRVRPRVYVIFAAAAAITGSYELYFDVAFVS